MADDIAELRRRVRPLLDLNVARDALTSYYALYHDPSRTRLFIHEGPTGRVEAFLAACQTGWDLFRLVAVLRARHAAAAAELLGRGLQPRRPFYLVATPDLREVVEEAMEVEQRELNRVYRLDMRRYAPAVNVLVVPVRTNDGSVRFVIRSQGVVAAQAGITWRSPHFAEVYVWTAPESRGRGWGKAVVESCVAWLIRSGVQPIYVVPEDNEPSLRLAESVGFVDTSAREFAVTGVRRVEGDPDHGGRDAA